MKQLLLFIVVLVALFNTTSAYYIEYGNNVNINKPVMEDLYIAGGTVTINAPVHGDLIIAGGTIIINDTVTNDILLAGGNVTFNGFVGDDIRCAGGNIRISKNVSGDVVVTAGGVILDKGTMIGGLLASGGNISLDGDVNGEVKGAFGNLFVNGHVAKNIDCRGGRISINGIIDGKSVLAASHIDVGNKAVFNNDVRYWNKKGSLDFKQSVRNGNAVYDESLRIKAGEWYFLGATSVLGLLWYLGMALIMILIIQYLFASTMKRAADTAFNYTVQSLGSGALYFIVVPVAALIAFITIIGVPVGLLLLAGYFILFALASVITSVVTANWFNNRFDKKWDYWRMAFAAFGVFVFLKLVSLTPFAGWLVMIFMVCMAFGSIILNVKRSHEKIKQAPG